MPTLIDAGKTSQTRHATAVRLWRAQCGAPQLPGDVGRNVEVGVILWVRALP